MSQLCVTRYLVILTALLILCLDVSIEKLVAVDEDDVYTPAEINNRNVFDNHLVWENRHENIS